MDYELLVTIYVDDCIVENMKNANTPHNFLVNTLTAIFVSYNYKYITMFKL